MSNKINTYDPLKNILVSLGIDEANIDFYNQFGDQFIVDLKDYPLTLIHFSQNAGLTTYLNNIINQLIGRYVKSQYVIVCVDTNGNSFKNSNFNESFVYKLTANNKQDIIKWFNQFKTVALNRYQIGIRNNYTKEQNKGLWQEPIFLFIDNFSEKDKEIKEIVFDLFSIAKKAGIYIILGTHEVLPQNIISKFDLQITQTNTSDKENIVEVNIFDKLNNKKSKIEVLKDLSFIVVFNAMAAMNCNGLIKSYDSEITLLDNGFFYTLRVYKCFNEEKHYYEVNFNNILCNTAGKIHWNGKSPLHKWEGDNLESVMGSHYKTFFIRAELELAKLEKHE